MSTEVTERSTQRTLIPGTICMDYDEKKFQELILYIAEKSADDPSFGDTKLNKLLFFADFFAYANFGAPITGATYQKLEHGPAPRRLLPARSELVKQGRVTVVKKGRYHRRRVTVPRESADTRLFDSQELELVDELIDVLQHSDATDIRDLSHRVSAGWNLVEMYEDIPYETVFVSTRQPPPRAFERGREIARELAGVSESAKAV